MMLFRRPTETPGGCGCFGPRDTLYGSNYSDQSNKEQGEKGPFVRFSEQRPTLQRFILSGTTLGTALVIGFEKYRTTKGKQGSSLSKPLGEKWGDNR